MSVYFPCEIMKWKILPAIRREMTIYLINEKKNSRKIVSKKLGLTEAAICQYLKGKRGGNFKFGETELKKIKKLANKLMQQKSNDGLCFICKEFDLPKTMLKKAINEKEDKK